MALSRLTSLMLGLAMALGGGIASAQTFTSLDGQPHTLADYHGKVVVVNFWATWCVPCQHELPLFADAQKKYGVGLQVVAVSVDEPDTRPKVAPFVAEHKLPFPVLLGTPAELKSLGLGVAIPATAFLDEKGNVVERILGEVSSSDLRKRLDYLVKKKGSPPPALLDKFAQKKKDNEITPIMH